MLRFIDTCFASSISGVWAAERCTSASFAEIDGRRFVGAFTLQQMEVRGLKVLRLYEPHPIPAVGTEGIGRGPPGQVRERLEQRKHCVGSRPHSHFSFESEHS